MVLSLVISLVSQDVSLLRGGDVFRARKERKQFDYAKAKARAMVHLDSNKS